MFMPLFGYLHTNRAMQGSSKVVGNSILSKTKGQKWKFGASSKCFVDNKTMAFEATITKQVTKACPSVKRSYELDLHLFDLSLFRSIKKTKNSSSWVLLVAPKLLSNPSSNLVVVWLNIVVNLSIGITQVTLKGVHLLVPNPNNDLPFYRVDDAIGYFVQWPWKWLSVQFVKIYIEKCQKVSWIRD